MPDLKFFVLDRFSVEDLETALIRKSNREQWCNFEATLMGDAYTSKDIKPRISEKQRVKLFQECFSEAIHVVDRYTQGLESDKDHLLLTLNSFRKIVTLDMAYSHLAQFVYKDSPGRPGLFLPSFYCDEKGQNIDIEHKSRTPVDIKGKIVAETPNSISKWKGHIKRTDDLDAEKYENGVPIYYPGLNLILQGAGSVHRTAEAFIRGRSGTAMVHEYNDEPLYKHVSTDGAYWLNKHTGEKLGKKYQNEISDYRLALIFAIKQREIDIDT